MTRFFGVDSSNEEQARTTWVERRRRLAIKKLGGVKVSTSSQAQWNCRYSLNIYSASRKYMKIIILHDGNLTF